MFGLFRRAAKSKKASRCVPNATRVYAIGDIHGCLDALDRLLSAIADDATDFPGQLRLLFLGDLVDRGPDSAGVIDRILHGPYPGALERSHPEVLMGNHEEAMLAAYDGESDVRGWLNYGGVQTLESYGISRADHFSRGFDLGRRMHELIPAEHIAFLRGRPDHVRVGDFLFVHAGIRPGVAIERQHPADLRWIRSGFLDSDTDHGMTVVHGHTISDAPQQLANRIGIDTGCYAGGELTALVLEGAEQRFIQVSCVAVLG